MTRVDAAIWQSAQNILRAQHNLDMLVEAFDEVAIEDAKLTIEHFDSDKKAGDFLQPVWNEYYSHQRTDKQGETQQLGSITLAVQLTSDLGPEADWDEGRLAKVLVAYRAKADTEAAWTFDIDAPNASGYCDGCTTQRTHWILDEDGDASWFFAVPLDELVSTQTVRDLIVKPVHSILRGVDIDTTLSMIETRLCLPPSA